jgi:hypothetical protein
VGVLRRPRARAEATPATERLLPWTEAVVANDPQYEYLVLVTNLTWGVLALAEGYRQRADCENNYDQLKNQWGWGGFTTKDLLRCQVAARHVALIDNWWSLFTRLAEPTRPREALTRRPLLLSAVGRLVRHGGQTILRLTSQHAAAAQAQQLLTGLSLFLSGLQNTAEQLTSAECWRRIYARILAPYLQPQAALPGPSG